MQTGEQIVDVRNVIPRERHPRIFGTFETLPAGGQLLLINDHDPVPLYYQFAVEYAGGFRWDYLEQGPDTWRVRISKGDFADPGFVPGRRPAPIAIPLAAQPPLVLDVRPVFARGESPCSMIDEAIASLVPGQSFVILAPFEPRPLYGKLGALGFSGQSAQMGDGTWRLEFTPGATPTAALPHAGCCGH